MIFETMVLSNLMIKPCYGYELKGMLREFNPNNNKIYPVLKKLADKQYIEVEYQHQNGKPSRKIYTITPAGREYFVEVLSTLGSQNFIDDDDFYIRLAFSDLLTDSVIKETIDKRKKFLDLRKETGEHRIDLENRGEAAGILKDYFEKQDALEHELLAKLEGVMESKDASASKAS